ncbi:MAG: PorT family protein [Bacteroidetes bacterium]|nr:PorT family protein [Bacteroidota bacterium]MBS1756411.1 PorT family protein [Bacteroidota bacterium]
MKKQIILFAFTLLACSTGVMAQGFHIGIKGGADINKLDGKSFKDQFSFGYQLGGFAEIGLTPKFGIQPEVIFSQTNIDTSSTFSSVYAFNNISHVKLQYLKIPILLNFKPNNFVALQLGPQFGINLDKNSNLFTNGANAFKTGDFSMVGGLQIEISKLRLYGRYAIGLNNINDIDNREKWKTQSIQLGIGLAF